MTGCKNNQLKLYPAVRGTHQVAVLPAGTCKTTAYKELAHHCSCFTMINECLNRCCIFNHLSDLLVMLVYHLVIVLVRLHISWLTRMNDSILQKPASQEEFEETPLLLAIFTYIGYGMLVMFGYLRELTRYYRIEEAHQSEDSTKNKVGLIINQAVAYSRFSLS